MIGLPSYQLIFNAILGKLRCPSESIFIKGDGEAIKVKCCF